MSEQLNQLELTALAELTTITTSEALQAWNGRIFGTKRSKGALDEAMSRFNNAERVKKVKVLGEEWLPDSELMTPTSKLKRRGIHSRFAEEIEAFYA